MQIFINSFKWAIISLLHINTSDILIKTVFQINKIVRIVKLFKIFLNVLMYSLMEDSWIFIVVSGLWDPWISDQTLRTTAL